MKREEISKKKSVVGTLYRELRQYKVFAFITPLFMVGEVVAEMVIPILMGSLVDLGISTGNVAYVKKRYKL